MPAGAPPTPAARPACGVHKSKPLNGRIRRRPARTRERVLPADRDGGPPRTTDWRRERGPGPSAAPAEPDPLAADQFAVPTEQRLRSDGERVPAGAGQATAEGREHQAVARAPGEPFGATSQNPHFLAQGEELEVAGRAAPAAEQGEVEEQAAGGIHERWQHRQPPGRIVPTLADLLISCRRNKCTPHPCARCSRSESPTTSQDSARHTARRPARRRLHPLRVCQQPAHGRSPRLALARVAADQRRCSHPVVSSGLFCPGETASPNGGQRACPGQWAGARFGPLTAYG
jgi:hypothetical protein